MSTPDPNNISPLAAKVAEGTYTNNADLFQRDLNSEIQGKVGRIENVSAWAQNQLRILSDMATDRGLKWVADEATRIQKGLEKP